MKRNFLLTGTLLMMLLLFYTIPAMAGQNTGRLESLNGKAISGWAVDSSAPDQAADIRVVVSNQTTNEVIQELTVKASEHRPDLAALGYGTGDYGFHVAMDWDKVEDGTYLIEAYANGQKLTDLLHYTKNAVNTMSASVQNSQRLRSLGVFKTTAYCPCVICSEGWGRRTSTGALATADHTIAVDPRVIPYGSKVMINGVIYTAEDKGGAVKGNHIDIYFNTHGETHQYGTRNAEVFLVQ